MAKTDNHGVPLIERVIARVQSDGFDSGDARPIEKPRPVPADVLKDLRFPGGERPSPSLLRWLAFDGGWLADLGWFEDPKKPVFTPQTLGEFALKEYGKGTGPFYRSFERHLPGQLYLLPQGSDSRRALYVGNPDSIGEHPVIVTDDDDLPWVGLMYPGFDVYMGALAGVIDLGKLGTYTALRKHRDYKARFAEHMKASFGGRDSFEFEGPEGPDDEEGPASEPPPYKAGDPVPAGYRTAINPFTKQVSLIKKR